MSYAPETRRRRTFAIISHPDAGKTTLTEKLLLFSGAIQIAGAVKGRKASRHATSDWMEIEKQRGISVASSVMQMSYRDHVINLLDTPSSGEILYHGKNGVGRGVNQPEYRSHVGMVFQSFNLFNNMTVLENCMVGQIKVLKRGKAEAREAAMTYLTMVGMAP